MWLVISVVLTTHTPTNLSTPQLVAAEQAWTAAEKETDAKLATAKWEAAAVAFEKALPSAGSSKQEAAYAAVLAWRNAMNRNPDDDEVKATDPFSKHETAFLHAIDVYLPLAPADDVNELKFIRAHLFYKHDKFDDALPIFEEIVTKSPSADVAEYSANFVLDAYNRQGKYDDLTHWTEEMRGMPKLLANREDLVYTLDRIHVQSLRKRAEKLEAAGDFLTCATTYRETAKANPKADARDELFYNAGVCFEQAGQKTDAVAMFREVVKLKTRLAKAAKARMAKP